MIIYGIATETHETYGHGDFGVERKISPEGAYGSGKYPPCFRRREDAEAYIAGLKFKSGKRIVELELRGTE